MADQDTSASTTHSTGDGAEVIAHTEGNSDDDEENGLLLSTICRLEIENLRMRKSINNFGFNLKDRILELEHEKRELINAMKLLKPDEDPAKFTVAENSKYVNVDFAQVLDTSSQDSHVDSVTQNNSHSSSTSSSTERPFASPSSTEQHEMFLKEKTTSSIPHSDCGVDNAHSQSLLTTLDHEEGSEVVPQKTARSSLRRHSYLNKSKRGGGSKNWDTGRDNHLEVGDTWQESGEKSKNGNEPGDQGDDDVTMGSKRQSTEMALSSMRLSMQNPIMENNIQQNFLEFYMIGVERSILSGEKEPSVSQQQPSEILNRFPAENTVFMDSIADFAFPRGAYLHLTRSVAYARSILRRKPAQQHILQFSDARGVPTFACCLTVTSVHRLHPSNAHHASVMTHLAPLLSRAHARHILIRFFRFVLRVSQDRREVVLNRYGVVVGYIRPRSLSAPLQPTSPRRSPVKSPLSFRKFTNSFFDRLGGGTNDGNGIVRRSSLDNNNNTSSNSTHNVDDGITISEGKMEIDCDDIEARRMELSPQSGFARSISISRDRRRDDSEDFSETSDDDSAVTDRSQSPPSSPNKLKLSPSSKKRGKRMKSKLKYAEEDDSHSHYLISQRAYVLLSAKPLHTFLFRVIVDVNSYATELVLHLFATYLVWSLIFS